MHFLSHSELPENADAPGLKEANEQLREAALSPEQRRDYFNYLDGLKSISAAVDTALYRGQMEGRAEGIELGKAEGIELGKAEGIALGERNQAWKNARKMKEMNFDLNTIAEITGLDLEELKNNI